MSESLNPYESLEKSALISKLVERDFEIEKLQLHIINANNKIYGKKTEKLSSEQIHLSFEVPEIAEQLPLGEQEIVVERHSRTVKRGRQPLPGDLPREQIIYEPEQTHCTCCNQELVTIGELKSEELEKIPAQLKVIEHIRIKKACANCKQGGVLVPPLPAAVFPLEKTRAGPGLLADIVVSKYVDHLPLHRQEQIFARLGIELRRQRMCDWVAGITELLMPLYKALKLEIIKLSYIHADETTLKVQDGGTPGKCHTGYLWGLHAPPTKERGALVWFHYDKSRAGSVPQEILKEFRGAVHTDAYAGYNPIYLPDRCVRLACLAHIRRAFLEVKAIAGKETTKILTLISQLYQLENNCHTAEQRFAVRQSKSMKIVDELFEFLKSTAQRTLPKSPLMKALNYCLNQEAEVRRIFQSGDFDLDNNAIERQMRPVAIGRKNYMFAGSHEGAHRAAVLYSLLNTCKLNKINPWEWMRDVLVRTASDKSVKAISLLPHNYRPAAPPS